MPESFYCPISHDIMVDPVIVATGHTYDRPCIERWLMQNRTCPVTGLRLPHLELTPNFALRNAMQVGCQLQGAVMGSRSTCRGACRRKRGVLTLPAWPFPSRLPRLQEWAAEHGVELPTQEARATSTSYKFVAEAEENNILAVRSVLCLCVCVCVRVRMFFFWEGEWGRCCQCGRTQWQAGAAQRQPSHSMRARSQLRLPPRLRVGAAGRHAGA